MWWNNQLCNDIALGMWKLVSVLLSPSKPNVLGLQMLAEAKPKAVCNI